MDLHVLASREVSDKWICTFWLPERSRTNRFVHSGFQRGFGQMDLYILASRMASDKWICTFWLPERSRTNGFARSGFQKGLGQMDLYILDVSVRRFSLTESVKYPQTSKSLCIDVSIALFYQLHRNMLCGTS